eukprot:TRINITY_DN44735_c0_g1_i1.p1 TRINITY_DN44735_c0_g1~~TRINITY_DN44735_c0_g1_i1.p1  ORF type:complete len:323 (+),score=55.53 TRINITY_DN44735_c0_g1_i1:46-1014(+)
MALGIAWRLLPATGSTSLAAPQLPRKAAPGTGPRMLQRTFVAAAVLPGMRRRAGTRYAVASVTLRAQQQQRTLWRRPPGDGSPQIARHELTVRLDALRLMQEMQAQLPALPPSAGLLELNSAVAAWNATSLQREEMEGHCAPEQLDFLRSFVAMRFGTSSQSVGGLKMCQIGFNAGHSAVALLDQAPEGSVLLSLDLCRHAYTRPLEKTVSRLAAERGQTHILLEGDSAEMLPRFRHIEFDLLFIDGNHAYEAVKLDFLLCLQMARPDAVVLLNHVFTDMMESAGPSQVWLEAMEDQSAQQLGWHSCCSRHGIAIARSALCP